MFLVLLGCFLLLLAWLVHKDRAARHYWDKLGLEQAEATTSPTEFIKSLSPGLPRIAELYSSTTSPLFGFYKGRSPVLMVRDPDIAAAVLKADFQHFTDKRKEISIDKDTDPLSQHLIGLTGEKWKSVRSKLTPVFSSGKIKESIPLFEEAVDSFTERLDKDQIDIYPATVTLVTDVILSYAFGLEKDDGERDKVREMGFRAIRSNWRISLIRAVRFYFPRLFGLLGLRAFDPDVTSFFLRFVRDVLSGKRSLTSRADFLSKLLGIANTVPEEEREGLLAAQVFSFFVAGFETTCFTISTCLYELCKHPEVVKKARQQLDETIMRNGHLTYEALKNAPYITQIIREAMRLYPADYATPRVCTKDYYVSKLDVTIEKGTEIVIPGFCLSRDPLYHPDPLVFNPDRFSNENKPLIRPGTYFPFGEGPRQCIAVRFSMLEVEYILSRLVYEYDMELGLGTKENLDFDPLSRVTHFKGNIFIKFTKRFQ